MPIIIGSAPIIIVMPIIIVYDNNSQTLPALCGGQLWKSLFGGKANGGNRNMHVCISAAFYNVYFKISQTAFFYCPHLLCPHLATPDNCSIRRWPAYCLASISIYIYIYRERERDR